MHPVNQDDGTRVMGNSAAAKISQQLPAPGVVLSVLETCLWFGIVAGLAERLLYFLFPRPVGGNDLWYDALADLLLFLALAVPALVLGLVAGRARLKTIAFFFCAGLFALDCLFVVWPPVGHRLGQMALLSGGALLIALVATALLWRFPSPLKAFGRTTLPLLLVYVVLFLGGSAWWESHKERVSTAALRARTGSPDVLLVIMDAVGANHLSTYGYGRATSPYLTELASHGLLFEKAVAPSSWTLPSHASMLTGRLPTEHQAGEYNWRLDARFPTLAEAFQHAGYRTAGFSGNTLLFNRRVGLARGYIHFEDGSLVERLLQTTLGQHIQTRLGRAGIIHNLAGRQDASEINQDALRWLRHGSAPFFVTVNYFDAHEPLLPPSSYFHRFSTLRVPLKGQYNWPGDIQLPPTQVKDEVDAYDASIAYIDEQISDLFKQLEARGLLKNAIVVVTSDHGQEFQEHGFMFHGKGLYWNLLHAPLLISWPGHLPGGERIPTPVALQSLPATLLTMAGVADDPFPGPSLTELWGTPALAQNWPAPISELAEMGRPRFPSYYGPMKSVVTPQWHYVQGGKSGQELYPCCDDEQRDLASTALGAAVSSTFGQLLQENEPVSSERFRAALRRQLLQSALQRPGEAPVSGRQKAANRQHMNDQLHALGYVP
ncbi:MAG TPA: sulfatase [Terriglobales bacterium]|jgi:arylsulfatase A-like enzyme|nr:sulfatase [Terriglobales bacterium]